MTMASLKYQAVSLLYPKLVLIWDERWNGGIQRSRGALGRKGENRPVIGNDGQKHRGRHSILTDMKSR